MATVPLSGTNIRFLSGVPFSNDYKHTRWFDDVSSQTYYFSNKTLVHSMDSANFQRIEGFNYVSVNKSIDELWGTNYVMFQNASYNNKWFYGFVTKLEYKQRNVTYVYFEIDVFQTWKFDMNFKPSFVVREHCPLWNADGTPVINTVDEGLNYGSEYNVVKVDNYTPYAPIYFLIIVTKEAMHSGHENTVMPTLNGSPQPLSYYVHPFKLDGSTPNVVIGGNTYLINSATDVMTSIFTQDTAVNNVVSLYVTEYIGYNAQYDSASDTITFSDVSFENVTVVDNVHLSMQTIHLKSVPSYNAITKIIGAKYDGYTQPTESKLLMYPYTVLILDDFKGNRQVLKNEYINGTDIEITVKGSLGTSNKVSYGITGYLNETSIPSTDKTLLSIEHSLINNNPNDVPILSDYLSAFLQGNRNTLENQKQTMMWNGVTNAIGNGIGGVGSALSANPLGVASSVTGVVKGAGDTVLQLQGIEAKLKDIDNIPPTLVKMGSNTAYDYGNNYQGLFIIKKQITPEYQKKLSDFFNMYGYKVNEVKTPNFHTRQNWNYVQTSSCVILGNFNNDDLNELKAIFDNGITFWHTDDVGNYSLANGVI